MTTDFNICHSENGKFSIESFLDLTDYATDIRRSRRKSKEVNSQEFFTPYSIVKRMCDKVDDATWADPTKTFLEPASGNGQFVCYIIWNRIQHGIDWRTALKTCYSVELMQDNVDEMKQRVHDMLSQLCLDYDYNEAQETMDYNFVCSDFFKWNFEEWRAYTSDELKQIEKDKKKKR